MYAAITLTLHMYTSRRISTAPDIEKPFSHEAACIASLKCNFSLAIKFMQHGGGGYKTKDLDAASDPSSTTHPSPTPLISLTCDVLLHYPRRCWLLSLRCHERQRCWRILWLVQQLLYAGQQRPHRNLRQRQRRNSDILDRP